MTRTYINNKAQMIEAFLDAESHKIYADGRLALVEDGDYINLVAYGKQIIASVSKDASHVELFVGHHGSVSRTVDRYISQLGRILQRTPNKTVYASREAAPTLDGYQPILADAAKYIDNYFSVRDTRSNVEQHAADEVKRVLRSRMKDIFN